MHSQFYNSKGFKKAEILVITSLLAFCSIIYELLLSNTLSIVTGNYIWWQSLTIGVYIGGLGLGAYFSDKLKNSYESIVRTEIGSGSLDLPRATQSTSAARVNMSEVWPKRKSGFSNVAKTPGRSRSLSTDVTS